MTEISFMMVNLYIIRVIISSITVLISMDITPRLHAYLKCYDVNII